MPQFTTGRIELAEQRPDGTLVWSLTGAAGFRYLVEKSVGDLVWRPLLVLTNEPGVVTFADPEQTATAKQFYRSRMLD